MGAASSRERGAEQGKISYPEDVVLAVGRSTGCRRSSRSRGVQSHAVFADDLSERSRIVQDGPRRAPENDGGIRRIYPIHYPERPLQSWRRVAAVNDRD